MAPKGRNMSWLVSKSLRMVLSPGMEDNEVPSILVQVMLGAGVPANTNEHAWAIVHASSLGTHPWHCTWPHFLYRWRISPRREAPLWTRDHDAPARWWVNWLQSKRIRLLLAGWCDTQSQVNSVNLELGLPPPPRMLVLVLTMGKAIYLWFHSQCTSKSFRALVYCSSIHCNQFHSCHSHPKYNSSKKVRIQCTSSAPSWKQTFSSLLACSLGENNDDPIARERQTRIRQASSAHT